MKVRMGALDPLAFGVGKPSVWGEDTFGVGRFPPFPSVARGAARASALYEHGSFDIANTGGDFTKEFTVSEYAVLLDEKPHFPAPVDLVWDEDHKTLIQCVLKENDGLSSLRTPCQLWVDADGKTMSAEKRYVSLASLQGYLNGEPVKESVSLVDGYVHLESRIGIYRRRDTNTVRDQMLYRSPLVRLNNAALVANIDGLKTDGVVRLGGKGKTAHFTKYDGVISPDAAIGSDGRFKLYLATPAIFSERCLPEAALERVGFLPKLPVQVKLLAAALYGYDSIGGFDMKAKCPKPMRRAVKAGSVYYYELAEPNEENRGAILALHGKRISDVACEDGFGICYIGKI